MPLETDADRTPEPVVPDATIPDTPPVAVTTPHNFLESGNLPHEFFRARFGPLLKLNPGERLYLHNQGAQYFVKRLASPGLFFPTDHALASREQYQWWVVSEDRSLTMLATPYRVGSFYDKPDSVKFGWPVAEEDVAVPSLEQKVQARQKTLAKETKWAVTMNRLNALIARGDGLDSAETEELAEIRKLVQRVSDEGTEVLEPKVQVR